MYIDFEYMLKCMDMRSQYYIQMGCDRWQEIELSSVTCAGSSKYRCTERSIFNIPYYRHRPLELYKRRQHKGKPHKDGNYNNSISRYWDNPRNNKCWNTLTWDIYWRNNFYTDFDRVALTISEKMTNQSHTSVKYVLQGSGTSRLHDDCSALKLCDFKNATSPLVKYCNDFNDIVRYIREHPYIVIYGIFNQIIYQPDWDIISIMHMVCYADIIENYS